MQTLLRDLDKRTRRPRLLFCAVRLTHSVSRACVPSPSSFDFDFVASVGRSEVGSTYLHGFATTTATSTLPPSHPPSPSSHRPPDKTHCAVPTIPIS